MDIDRKQSVDRESAILVGVELTEPQPENDQSLCSSSGIWSPNASADEGEAPLEELAGLAETAGAEIVGLVTQRRRKPDVKTYVGKGKLEQIKQMASATEADVVIFDNDLSPGQVRSLEEAIGVKVLDRTELILDIFSTRAQTTEARLAVELAQLEYSLPRLKQMWSHLSRLKMGVGMRGPGEKQLETDRRLVEKRISDLKADLEKIHRRRSREVAARSDRLTVSLVGYTNAGKSTLLNALTDSAVLAQDKLFATLDTRTRRWRLPGWGPVLLSDTVGFIRDLPHKLIASFTATLEEARQADLLLHVADASNPSVLEQIKAVYDVLEELDIEQKSTLLVLNKVDNISDPSLLNTVHQRYPGAVEVSAKSRLGFDRLANAVSEALSDHFEEVDIELSAANGRLLAYLARYAEVFSRRFEEDRVSVHCRIPREHLGRISSAEAVIVPHEAPEADAAAEAESQLDLRVIEPPRSVDDVA